MSPKSELADFFAERLSGLKCDQQTTREYILGVFNRPPNIDDSETPLVVLWQQTKDSGRFETTQRLGDWLFWMRVFAPENLRHATVEYYDALGAMAYARCHLILQRKWAVYDELAGRFGELAHESRQLVVISR